MGDLSAVEIIIGILALVVSAVLIAVVLLQHGRSAYLGTVSGGSETFFGKNKGRSIDRILYRWTGVIAIVFVLLILILNYFSIVR